MKVLSLFDGISCAMVALERAGISVQDYYASEIDKYAIAISQKNYPDILHIGSVTDIKTDKFPYNYLVGVDLLIGGSPCQDLSIAKKNRKGLDGERSGLFWEYVRILREVKPKYFILENVASMPKEAKEIITKELGVEPIMINASLVSAQNRKRLFWTNIPNVTLPKDKGILLKDILESGVDEKYYLKSETKVKWIEKGLSKDGKAKSMTATMAKGVGNDGTTLVYVGRVGNKDWAKNGGELSRNAPQGDRIYDPQGKSATLSAMGGGRGAKTGLYKTGELVRKLTPIECERLQGLPDNYTQGLSDSQRYKCLGNAFNVDVVAHILSFIPR